jgi:hypothetical protein
MSCSSTSSKETSSQSTESCACKDKCTITKTAKEPVCKLTSPELRERKETVIASLRKKVLEKKELSNGYAFKFGGSDEMLDELTTFIKAERQCCDFFTFNLQISGDQSELWLELTGAEGAKDFIRTELEL